MRRIRLLFATFALVGTALAVGLSPVMAQSVEQEDVEQEQVFVDEVAQEEVAPDKGLAPDVPAVVVLFDAEGNPFSCSRVDTNADGVSELVCVPQTATVPLTATDDTATDDTDTDETATEEEDEEEAEEEEEEEEEDDE